MWKYKGKGEYLPGVPARDLTDDEAKLHQVEESDLYEYEKDEPSATAKPEGVKKT